MATELGALGTTVQFNIRFLLGLTLAFALAITTVQLGAGRYPELWIFAIIASFVFAMYGLALVVLSGMLAFAILASACDENRAENLRRCAGLAGAGTVAFIPIILLFVLAAFTK